MRKRDGGFRLPTPATTSERRCVRISVPDDPVHIANLRGALYLLARASEYEAGRQQDARDAAQMWLQIVDELFQPCEGGGEEMDCNDVIDCMEPELQVIIAQQYNDNRTIWQQMPAVTDVQDAYDQGGATAVDPDATGLFRRDNTNMERYISIAAIYYVAAQWQMAQYNQLRTKALASSVIASISPQFLLLGAVVPAITGFFGLVNFIEVLPALETVSNFDALADVIASAWMQMEDEPETFIGWQTGALAAYYVDTPEEAALRDMLSSDFFSEEGNFIAYLAARQQISDRVYNGGQPFFGRGRHWVDDSLISNEYAEWILERSPGTSWFGVDITHGGFTDRPFGASEIGIRIDFGRAVDVTGWSIQEDVVHSGGAFTSLQNVRRVRLLLDGAIVHEQLFESNSIISFGGFSRGRGNGETADAIEIYASRNPSKTTSIAIDRVRVTGENFPPTRFWL